MRTDCLKELALVSGIFVLLTGTDVWAQTNARPSPPPPPLPPVPPGFAPGQNRPITFTPGARTNLSSVGRPASAPVFVQAPQPSPPGTQSNSPAAAKPVPIVVAPPPQPPAPSTPANALVFDAESKDYEAKQGENNAPFTFHLTNVWTGEVLVNSVRTSCGCTVASLPAQPWRLAPGTNGPIGVSVNLAGKRGKITKSITVDTSSGVKSLLVSVNIPDPTNAVPAVAKASAVDPDRQRNMLLAMADRQVVFKNDCAKCHADTGHGKMGKELYDAVCGICHDSPHRATTVPDLRALKHPTNAEHWKTWITSGRVGTMMPAFSQKEAGPLNDEQIKSLVDYLVQTIPSNPQLGNPPPTAAVQITPPASASAAPSVTSPK